MSDESKTSMSLGDYLRNLRDALRMTLREVEKSAGVSNAYLSQLENGKLKRPSPQILHKLAGVYRVSYESLMEKAGYLNPAGKSDEAGEQRFGRLPTFAPDDLTREEEEELLRYLAFLRSRKGPS